MMCRHDWKDGVSDIDPVKVMSHIADAVWLEFPEELHNLAIVAGTAAAVQGAVPKVL